MTRPSAILLLIHGMGRTAVDYWKDMTAPLARELGADTWGRIHVEPIYYQDILQPNQDRTWKAMERSSLHYERLRRFILFGFSDATAFGYQPRIAGSVYLQSQARIRAALVHGLATTGDASTPVIAMAHSLGCQVLSNAIWDAQHGEGVWRDAVSERSSGAGGADEGGDGSRGAGDSGAGAAGFERFGTLELLLTAGCNIPIFAAGLREIRAIDRPNPRFEWHNFYDADDVLGWPLKPLSDSYERVVTRDWQIESGSLLEKMTPLSHNAYFGDRDFIRPAADAMRTVLRRHDGVA